MRTLERPVPPMRGEQACQFGMVVLCDHHDRAIRLIANDHAELLWIIELLMTLDNHTKAVADGHQSYNNSTSK
jgi:hypothetical protein